MVFPVSVRAAKRGRGDASAWEASGLAAVDRFIVDTLDEGSGSG